jgi:hypothetical protein
MMKKFGLFIFSVLLAGSVVTMSSCDDKNKETPRKPSVSILDKSTNNPITNGATVEASSGEFTISIEATNYSDGAEVEEYKVTATQSGVVVDDLSMSEPADMDENTPVVWSFTFDGETATTITVYVMDDEDQTTTISFTVQAASDDNGDNGDDEQTALSSVVTGLVAGSVKTPAGAEGSYIDATGGNVYTSGDAPDQSANLDMIYGNEGGSAPMMYSPDDSDVSTNTTTLTTKNSTKFASVSGTDITAVYKEDLTALTYSASKISISNGGIYAYKAGTTYGAFVVKSAPGTSVTIDIYQ